MNDTTFSNGELRFLEYVNLFTQWEIRYTQIPFTNMPTTAAAKIT